MGKLYIVATPIGNLEDITIRAIKTLFSVSVIACEDTRKTGNLIQNYELRIKNHELIIKDLELRKPKLISYYDEIEFKRIPQIINLLQEGQSVALVSDSGTPLISDPGYKLIKECLRLGIEIESIPGPTSIISALVTSGLPINQFLFLGYLPSTSNKRKKLFEELIIFREKLVGIKPSIVFLESPHRIKESLNNLMEVFGDIDVVIARELTKVHEEIWRGKISEAEKKEFKGEIVFLFNYYPDVRS